MIRRQLNSTKCGYKWTVRIANPAECLQCKQCDWRGVATLALMLLVVTGIVSGCAVLAQEPPSTLIHGRYIYQSRGFIQSTVPFYEVGEITADGAGHWHLSGTMNIGGVERDVDDDWTYVMTKGMSGTAESTLNDHANFVISSDGSRINMVGDPVSGSPWMALFQRDPLP